MRLNASVASLIEIYSKLIFFSFVGHQRAAAKG